MKTVNTLQFKIYLIVFNLMSVAAMANDPGFPSEEDPGQQPAAPIDDWILPMMLLGVGIVFFYLKKRQPAIK
jgi:hypothetical protein